MKGLNVVSNPSLFQALVTGKCLVLAIATINDTSIHFLLK